MDFEWDYDCSGRALERQIWEKKVLGSNGLYFYFYFSECADRRAPRLLSMLSQTFLLFILTAGET